MVSLTRCLRLSIFTLLVFSCIAHAGEIHDAVAKGDLLKVKTLLEHNPSLVNAKHAFMQTTPLLIAVQDGQDGVLDYLLSHNADINAEGMPGYTALRWAVILGKRETAEFLIKRGARLDIYAAVSLGDKNKVLELLKEDSSQANPPQRMIKGPIDIAARDGHRDIAKILVENGADPSKPAGDKSYPLHEAARHGRTEVMKYLLEQKVGVDPRIEIKEPRLILHRNMEMQRSCNSCWMLVPASIQKIGEETHPLIVPSLATTRIFWRFF